MWPRVLEQLQWEADPKGRLHWVTHHVDGSIVRAHQPAAGAVGGQEREALGCSRNGFSTKVPRRAAGGSRPTALVRSGGERHESHYVQALLAHGQVRRPEVVGGRAGVTGKRPDPASHALGACDTAGRSVAREGVPTPRFAAPGELPPERELQRASSLSRASTSVAGHETGVARTSIRISSLGPTPTGIAS